PLPQGFATGRAIALAGQIASHLGNGRALGFCRHTRGHLSSLSGNTGEQVGIQELASGALRVATCQVSQVQQTDRQGRQQAQQAYQTSSGLHLTLFQTASGFETTSDSPPPPSGAHTTRRAPKLARASWWAARSTESLPRALLWQASALPTLE